MRHREDLSLSDVMPSAAAAVGVPGFEDRLDVRAGKVVVVCLVDGLGAATIEAHAEAFPALVPARGGSIEAAFPTTTATGLATLGTGLDPGTHGIVGASFRLPETEGLLSPLHWGSDPPPVAVQPERTVFETIAEAGHDCLAVGPAAYAGSGLTRAVLRGAHYVHAETIEDRLACVAAAIDRARSLVAYVYWPALDRAGHEFGVDSPEWRSAARQVNDLIAGLRGLLPEAGRLVVTADHGMVACGERIWIEDEPGLTAGVQAIGGEPRMRHVYTRAHESEQVARRWSDHLGPRACVLTRTEAIDRGLFGAVEPALADRIGDVVVVCEEGTSLASRIADQRLSGLPGQHGGLSDAERRVPGLVLDGG